MEYVVCDSCMVVLFNADTSAHIEKSDLATVEASIESMGHVISTGETVSGYADCYVCGYVAIDGHVVEAENNF